MTMPLFDENADDAPAVAMEYKVHVDPGKEECYFQFVQKGATIYVSFQVSTFLNTNVCSFLNFPISIIPILGSSRRRWYGWICSKKP